MSLNTICDDLLINIMSYISDNRSSYSFVNTCKYLQNLFSKSGYLKYLSVSGGVANNDLWNFSLMYIYHHRTIKTLSMSNIFDAHIWVQGPWCKSVYFYNCSFSSTVKPTSNSETEKLYLTSYSQNKIIIDFENLKKLTVLYVECYVVDLLNFEKCADLNSIHVKTRNFF